MATVTVDIKEAKHYVQVSRKHLAYLKARAHQAHRRAWHQALNKLRAEFLEESDALENLNQPRLTGWDIS